MKPTIKYFIFILSICFGRLHLLGQQNKIDSLLSIVKTAKEDTVKVNTMNELSNQLWRTGQYHGADSIAHFSLQLAEKLNFQKGKADAYNNIGLVNMEQGNYPQALENLSLSLKINQDNGNRAGIASCYGNSGLVYYEQGNYPEALKNQFADLEIAEQIQNKRLMANAYTNIGNIYTEQGNYTEALKNQFANLKIAKELNNKKLIANAYTNIGNNYYYQQNYQEASKNYFASLKINEEIGNKKGVAIAYNNIGEVLSLQGKNEEALKNHFAALAIRKEIGDTKGIASSYINLGSLHIKLKKFAEAKEYLENALSSSKEIGSKDKIKTSYLALAQLDSTQGNYLKAYDDYKMYITYRDSLLNEKNTKKTVQAQMQYEYDKKDTITKIEREKEKQKQRIVLGSVACGLLLVIIFSIFLGNRYRIIRKQNMIIEEKNKNITDSINYALRIQQAFLPDKKEIYSSFPQSFILFKGKDIVSGDFYFFHKNEQSAIIAAVDCTGHGVPGAFMSMVGSERLTDAVQQSNDTSEILSLLNAGVKKSLHQSTKDESTRDGMDIALCSVDTVSRIVKYAGAYRPLWIIRKGQTTVEEIKATKTAIGGFTEDNQHFLTHEIQLQQGDTFYIFTDGYADTFSGQDSKKLTTKKFKEILLGIQNKTMQEQEKRLDDFIESWKAGTEPVDDILVIGVRL